MKEGQPQHHMPIRRRSLIDQDIRRFARIKRQVEAMVRNGQSIDPNLLQEAILLDNKLSNEAPHWKRNFDIYPLEEGNNLSQ